MTLAREWTRQLFQAWGVALLGPFTVIAALVVLAIGGGFGGLGALAQLVSGPAVPAGSALSAAAPGARPGHRGAPGLSLPVVPAAAPTSSKRVAATTPRLVPAPTTPSSPGGSKAPGRGGVSPGQRIAPTTHIPTTTTGPTSTPPPPPTTPAPAAPLPALVNGVVSLGTSVTGALPAPLNQVGTQLLQGLGNTLDSILSPPS